MGQMVLIDEEELNNYKMKAAWWDDIATYIEKCANKDYDYAYWADTGNQHTIVKCMFDKYRTDSYGVLNKIVDKILKI